MKVKIRTIPWITDEANDFLFEKVQKKEIDSVLEFGSGASTLWFAERVNLLVSIEHDPKWYKKISDELKSRDLKLKDYILGQRPYHEQCFKYENTSFDLVVVDGRDRVLCVKASKKLVKPGGYLILDNSERERYKEVFDIMKDWEEVSFIQNGVDKTGWEAYEGWTTTVWKRV